MNSGTRRQRVDTRHVVHKKSGTVYQIISESVINATNAQDGQCMVAYMKVDGFSSAVFVRERGEFWEKFERFGRNRNR